jgi:hypothetical protein
LSFVHLRDDVNDVVNLMNALLQEGAAIDWSEAARKDAV